jgi:hypothetical protein
MPALSFQERAEDCRRKALCYVGRPEVAGLLRAAREFELLERQAKPCSIPVTNLITV